ncbi:MAG: tetratricopeptide repeat protein [Candidatus Nitronauta litoralis]|uniref:Tetratricopeptide repeat protein n=1 Tax=Candidatus Nitronauta litoralis TaxID=2705533 RepID=A0A7T0BXE7_9BACT|nr:MAG: tetratricopeptide repeat protein [Candidatus Nitronauta litoralis]
MKCPNIFNRYHLIPAALVTMLLFPLNASATFPNIDIALWDPHFSKTDRSKPEYLQILELAKNKKFAQALTIVKSLEHESPHKGTPLILKSLLLFEVGKYVESQKAMQKARDIQPRHPAVHYHHCQLYRQLGVVDLAERSCNIAVQQHPERPEAHYEAALTLAAQGRMKDANQALKKAASLDPKNEAYAFQMGLNYNYLNEIPQAIESFSKALELNPEYLEAAYQLGYAYATQNNMAMAKRFLNRVYDTRQSDPDDALKFHPQVEAARVLLEFLRTNGPEKLPTQIEPAKYHLGRSQKLYKEGEYGLSLFEIQTAARLDPENVNTRQILVGLASLFLRIKVAEQAVNDLLKSAGDNKNLKAKGLQELGDLYVMRGNLKQAKEFYTQAVELGDPGEIAKISLDELPKEDSIPPTGPENNWYMNPPEALNQKGEIFAHYGMYQRAVNLYSMALRMDPNNLNSKLNTAMAYFGDKQFNRAIAILEKTLVTHPTHSHLFSHRILLAKAYANTGNDSEVLKNLKEAKEINPAGLKKLRSDPAFKKIAQDPVFE